MIPLIRLGAVNSTQSYLNSHPELGFCGVMADSQSAGRGRGGNSWESVAGGGLWLSARLPVPSISSGTILQGAMTSVIKILAPCGAALGMKWPNDLVAYRQKSLVKIGGIIGEHKNDCVVLGLGLNIFSAPHIPERAIPPASLVSLGAVDIPEMGDLAMQILTEWQSLTSTPDTQCSMLNREQSSEMENTTNDQTQRNQAAFRWPEHGDEISWEDGSGICQGWEQDGRLAVRTKAGLILLASGDVRTINA